MPDRHQAWLQEREKQSRAMQEAFMDEIASKLGRPRIMEKPSHPFRGAPDFWTEKPWTLEQNVALFTDNFQAAGGHVARVADLEEAVRYISEKAAATKARRLIRQNQAELSRVNWEEAIPHVQVSIWNSDPAVNWKAVAAEAEIGVVVADGVAAYTGSVLVTSSPDKGRSVSLLPAMLFLLIPLERVKTHLGELLKPYDEMGRAHLPAGIHFISGPSRSADIENDLTIGVHGPGIVYALLIG